MSKVMNRSKLKHLESEVIFCKNGCGGVIAACHTDCIDRDWRREVNKYRGLGHQIDTVTHDLWNWCKCGQNIPKEIEVSFIDPNQLSIW